MLLESHKIGWLSEKKWPANFLADGDWPLPNGGLGFLIYLTLLKHCTPNWGPGFLLSKFNAYSCEIKCSGLRSGCLIQWEIHVSSLAEPGLSCFWCTDTVLPGCIFNSFSHVHSHVPGKILKYHIFHVYLFLWSSSSVTEAPSDIKKTIAMYCMLYNIASDVPLFGCKP